MLSAIMQLLSAKITGHYQSVPVLTTVSHGGILDAVSQHPAIVSQDLL
jgi:hypothetical protein